MPQITSNPNYSRTSSDSEFNCIFLGACNLLYSFRIPMLTPHLWKFRILFLIHRKTKKLCTTVRVTQSLNKNHTHHILLCSTKTQLTFEASESNSVATHSITTSQHLHRFSMQVSTTPKSTKSSQSVLRVRV